MSNVISKATFSEIYKIVKNSRDEDIRQCFNSVFDIGLLFLPGLICPETAIFTKIGDGVNLLGAKEAIGNSVTGIVNTFKNRKYIDFTTRYEHMQIAQVMIAYAAYFDSIKLYLPNEEREICLSDEEKYQITQESIKQYTAELKKRGEQRKSEILETDISMPDPMLGFSDYLDYLKGFYEILNREFRTFLEKMSVFEGLSESGRDKMEAILRGLPQAAVNNYKKQFYELAACFPDFAVWADMREYRMLEKQIDVGFERIRETLNTFEERSAENRVKDTFQKYKGKYDMYIEAPVVTIDEMEYDSADNVVFPAKKENFVPQQFQALNYRRGMQLEKKGTWANCKVRDDIGSFISSILRHPRSTCKPILILGHAGAGKTLLCHMLAAQILYHEYHVIIIRLRDTLADATMMQQVNNQIERDWGNGCSWNDIVSGKLDKPILLIFDGYDELLQASGKTYSRYLQEITQFQKEQERINGVCIRCIVTSRDTLIDKALIPEYSTVLQLQDFDKERIVIWSGIWNKANADFFQNNGLQPFAVNMNSKVSELAKQPLLLLMLALYDSNGNALKQRSDMNRSQLYDSLIREFISREKRKDSKNRQLTETDELRLINEEMEKIGVAALGMYNRNVLYIHSSELQKDLTFLNRTRKTDKTACYAELTESENLLGSFFFIHKSDSTGLKNQEEIHSAAYEFLHNTFGEFLTADFILREVGQVLHKIQVMTENDIPIGWNDTLKHRWYSCLAYAPLFARPVVVQMIFEWAEHYFDSLKMSKETAEKVMDILTGHELREILSGEAMVSIRETAREKENPFKQKEALIHLGIYSVNLMILRTVLCGDTYQLDCGKNDLENLWDKLICIWKYAFSEDELGKLANIIQVKRENEKCILHYLSGKSGRDGESREEKGREEKLYSIYSALGDDLSRMIMAVALGKASEYELISGLLRENHLRLQSEYAWQLLAEESARTIWGGKLRIAELKRLGTTLREKSDVRYVCCYYLLIHYFLKENVVSLNSNVKIFVSAEILEGLIYLGRYDMRGDEKLKKFCTQVLLELLDYAEDDETYMQEILRWFMAQFEIISDGRRWGDQYYYLGEYNKIFEKFMKRMDARRSGVLMTMMDYFQHKGVNGVWAITERMEYKTDDFRQGFFDIVKFCHNLMVLHRVNEAVKIFTELVCILQKRASCIIQI